MVIDILRGKDKNTGIFVDDNKLRLTIDDRNHSVSIKENQKDAKLRKVTITDISEQTIGIKIDAYGKDICNLFNNSTENINKGSDALIYTECIGDIYKNSDIINQKYIVIADLKSKVSKGFDLQMKSTFAFTEYVKAVVNQFYPNSNIEEFKLIYVLFSSKNKPKSCTCRKNTKYGTIRQKNGIKYLDCYAHGDKFKFHLKKIIREYYNNTF